MKGAHLLIGEGRARRYTGLIPKISPLAVLTIALSQLKLNRMAKGVPLEEPWNAKRAEEWDSRSAAWYLERSGIRSTVGRDLFEMALRSLFASDLDAVSFLDLLFLVRAHGSINTLLSIEGGSQENLVDGGAGSIAQGVADELRGAVRLNAPVHSITQHRDRVLVEAEGLRVSAPHAVVAVPPALALEIAFDLILPNDRTTMYRKAIAGSETKTLLVYDEPFWRTEGWSGQTAEAGSAAEVTLDATPASGSPGIIASFTFGRVAERVEALDATERRHAVLDALAARLGRAAASPREFVETAWWTEEWTRGCSMAHFPPGILTRYGPLLRQPFERVHWAGTETSTTSHGAIDRAVRSGERASTEILDRLAPEHLS